MAGPNVPSAGSPSRAWIALTAVPLLPSRKNVPVGAGPSVRPDCAGEPGAVAPAAAKAGATGPTTIKVLSAVDARRRRL